jgi:DNA-binding SARP family transcriptional activator
LGEAALAQDIFDEGWTEELRETFAYNAGLAWRFAIAEDYPQAEWFARAALELLPTAKGLEIGAGFDEMTAYYVLIIGLAKQDKPYDDAIMSFREYLKSQEQDSERLAEEYYFTAFVLADAVPGAARLFLQHARELHPKGGDGDLYEMWACEKLQDDECLLDMVHRREVSPQFAAELYARAGDGESMRRALQKLKAVHPCRISTYEVLIRRLTVDKNFGEAEAWVGNLVQCQLPHEPNYPKRVFFATSSNRWGDIARVYDVLSYAQSEAGMQEEALESAQAALILIREMDLTWNDNIAGPQSLDIIPPLAKTLGALATAEHRR